MGILEKDFSKMIFRKSLVSFFKAHCLWIQEDLSQNRGCYSNSFDFSGVLIIRIQQTSAADRIF